MLPARLQEMAVAGIVSAFDGARGPEYTLTESGQELTGLVITLGAWSAP